MRLIIALLSANAAFGQVTLTLTGPAIAQSGKEVTLTITAAGTDPQDTGASGLQWTIGYPPGLAATTALGAPVSGKKISCNPDFSACLTSGLNALNIPNAAIAFYTFIMPVTPGPLSFPLTGLVATDRAGNEVAAVSGPPYSLTVVSSDLSTHVYTVTNAAAFPSLPLPARSLVFRNGILQSPGANYTVSGGAFRFISGVLANGDKISVVTIP